MYCVGEMEKVLKAIKPIEKSGYRTDRQKCCFTCGNNATKLVSFTLDACTKIERYCDDCINSDKHMTDASELVTNFDDYFIRRVDEPYWPGSG